MRTRPATLMLFIMAVVLTLNSTGCTIAPGSDPIVVNSERSTAASFDAIDGFLNFEHANRAVLVAKAPELHAFAETLRKDAPNALKTARATTAVYKASRNPADGQKAVDAVSLIETYARQAREALLQAQKVMG